jgi:hypothetical protein
VTCERETAAARSYRQCCVAQSALRAYLSLIALAGLAIDAIWRVNWADPIAALAVLPLRQNFFRAGHAHAGVIVILSLVCQILSDAAGLPSPLLWAIRIGVPLSAILISSGFFVSVLPPTATQASAAVSLIYAGAVILAFSVFSLGVGLLRHQV